MNRRSVNTVQRIFLGFFLPLFGAALGPDERPYRVDHRLEPDGDRLDRSVWYSTPHSLHLRADLYGENIYRFPPRAVKPGKRYRLSFAYLTAANGYASCTVRVAQYGSGPTSWLSLDGGTLTRKLPAFALWRAETVDFTTLPAATNVEVDFRLEYETPVGECWIDSASLRPVGVPVLVGP